MFLVGMWLNGKPLRGSDGVAAKLVLCWKHATGFKVEERRIVKSVG